MSAPVIIYNLALEKVAYLQNATGIGYKKKKDEVWTASFSLPADDVKNDDCQELYYAEIFDGDERIELFRIVLKDKKRSSKGIATVHYQCKHVLSTLNDDELVGEHNAGPGVNAAWDYILGKQTVTRWQRGTNEISQNFYHYWRDISLLKALYTIPERFLGTHLWTFDTESYPWTLNLVEAPTDISARISYKLNLQQVSRKSDVRNLYTRLYAYGYGAGADQIDLDSVDQMTEGRPGFTSGSTEFTVGETLTGATSNETAVVTASYLVAGAWGDGDAEGVVFVSDVSGAFTDGEDLNGSTGGANMATLDSSLECVYSADVVTRGVLTRKWEDQRYTAAADLYAAAEARVDLNSIPNLTYRVKAADLHRLSGVHEFVLGDLIEVYDTPLDIDVDARIVALSKKDVQGKPGDIDVQLGNKIEKFPDFGGIVYADDLDGVKDGTKFGRVLSTQILAGEILLSAVPGNTVGAFPATPTVAGLYLGATHHGYHDGTNWITYTDNAGKAMWEGIGGDTGHMHWDPAGGGALEILGSITATTGAIGGWTIGTHTITAASGVTGLNSEVTGGVDWRIWAGHATPGSAPFRVDESGNLVASAATITGAITASSGTIGGFTIGASALTAGSGATSVGLTPGSYPFHAGHATPASAPFRVTTAGALVATSATITGAITSSSVTITGGTLNINSGVFSVSAVGALVATSATITGSITASSGSIGGFTIGASALTAGSGGTAVGIAPATYPFYAGSATAASAPFRVSNAGAVTCTNLTASGATISGALTMGAGSTLDGSYITAGTITGRTVRTAASGARAMLETVGAHTHEFLIYGASALEVSIGPSNMDFPTGGQVTATGALTVQATTNLYLTAVSGVMTITAGTDLTLTTGMAAGENLVLNGYQTAIGNAATFLAGATVTIHGTPGFSASVTTGKTGVDEYIIITRGADTRYIKLYT